jgi:hypothetical protein
MTGPALELAPLLRSLTIKDKDNLLTRFDVDRVTTDEHGCIVDFGWAQREMIAEIERQYNAGQPVRIIVLKARQLGISTLTEAVLFLWNFLHPGSAHLVLAHDSKSTRSLFDKTKLYWRTWRKAKLYKLLSDTQHRLQFEHLSSMEVASAKSTASARGMTLSGVHASEVSRWEQPEDLWQGLNQAVPNRHGTIVVQESTANGMGDYFHKTWQRSEMGNAAYAPLFFPWWKHYEYTARHNNLDPTIDFHTKDECWLRDNLGLDDDRLAWRRWKILELDGNEEKFREEFPATPDEAFISSGSVVFPLPKLKECYTPERGKRGWLKKDTGTFVADPTGPLTIFRNPNLTEHGAYFVAGDPTYTTQNDRACIQVINRRTLEQVAVWHGYIDPIRFGDEIVALGRFYNDAMVSTEVNGPGYGSIGRIMSLDYPHVWRHQQADRLPGGLGAAHGWFSNMQYKEQQVSFLKYLVLQGVVGPLAGRIHDAITLEQLRDYVTLSKGIGFGNSDPKGFDDAVSALSQAYICSAYEGPLAYIPEKAHVDGPVSVPKLKVPIMPTWDDDDD